MKTSFRVAAALLVALLASPSLAVDPEPQGGGGANATKLQGRPVSSTAPTTSQTLTWNGSAWIPASGSSGGVTSITGTTNQVTASASTGAVTLSLPQSIHTAATPTFAGATLSGLTANSFTYTGAGGLLSATSAPTNGQLLIGSTGAAPVAAALTAGTGVSVTNGAGSITLANTGVTSAVAGTGIGVSGATGAVTISNNGVTSATGTANQVNVSASTGAVTFSLPQSIATSSAPTFAGATLSSPLVVPVGSVSAVSVGFTSDPNTGLYSSSHDSLGLVTGGAARFTLSTSAMTTTLPLRGQAGTVSAPAVSFSSDTDTGLYNTANVLLFAAGGTAIANVSATGITVTSGVFTCPGSAGAGTEKFGSGCDAAATNSVAGGYGCTTGGASGGPVVWGWGSSASGLYATTLGAQSNATGDATTAIGGGVVVSGAQSTGLGTGATTSTATLATALGAYATATGTGAIAIGGNAPQATHAGAIALGAAAVTDSANQLKIGSAGGYHIERQTVVAGSNGQGWSDGVATEILTLSTVGTTTDTSANLLPADSIIYAVTTYVTATISGGGVASYSIGDPTTGTRFASGVTGLASGSTKVGLGAPASAQVSAAKIRITASATPSAGQVRVTVHYRTFTPPSS